MAEFTFYATFERKRNKLPSCPAFFNHLLTAGITSGLKVDVTDCGKEVVKSTITRVANADGFSVNCEGGVISSGLSIKRLS